MLINLRTFDKIVTKSDKNQFLLGITNTALWNCLQINFNVNLHMHVLCP